MMEIELRVAVLETERRWNWRQFFDANVLGAGTVLGTFLSYRDDDTFVWLHAFDDEDQRARLTAILAGAPSRCAESVRRLTPSAAGSTVRGNADLAVLAGWPVIEIRQYRLAPGTRSRFTRFLFEKTLEPQKRCGMSLAGPFDDLEDENVQTWFRGFTSLAERDGAKAAFYQSNLWLDDLEAEAFTMIEDYSNVMLVTPA
jgi:hypothetical protein